MTDSEFTTVQAMTEALLNVSLLRLPLPQLTQRLTKDILLPQAMKEYRLQVLLPTIFSSFQEKILYTVLDSFYLHYTVFLSGEDYIVIGPYLTDTPNEKWLEEIIHRNGLPMSSLVPIQLYISSLPVIHISRVIFVARTVARLLYGTEEELPCQELGTDTPPWRYDPLSQNQEADDHFVMAQLEERYEAENQLLLYVEKGDKIRALETYYKLGTKTRHIVRESDLLRNAKNLGFVVNTLLRKAAERGAVHPVYIDSISSKYARRIENCFSREQVNTLQIEMISSYCDLVNRLSLRSYSPLVRRAINYININISADLSLKNIASKVNISPNYLSGIFNREVKVSIAEYINQRRVEQAAYLLTSQDSQIQNVAAAVGYCDVNYFSKVFKKYTGTTPSEYKKRN